MVDWLGRYYFNVNFTQISLNSKNKHWDYSAKLKKLFIDMNKFVQVEFRVGANPPEGMTAPTDVAGVNVDGVTIHNFAGVRLGLGDEEELLKKVERNPKALNNWRVTKVLMIDEISMLESEVFSKLASIGGKLNNDGRAIGKPFGNIQLVTCGDYFQLSPVQLGYRNVGHFAFSSPAWAQLGMRICCLTKIIRQKDGDFINMLNSIHWGIVTPDIVDLLQACPVSHKPLPTDGIKPPKLLCVNRDVDEENMERLHALTSNEVVFSAGDRIKAVGSVGRSQVVAGLKEDIDKKVPGHTDFCLTLKIRIYYMREMSGSIFFL